MTLSLDNGNSGIYGMVPSSRGWFVFKTGRLGSSKCHGISMMAPDDKPTERQKMGTLTPIYSWDGQILWPKWSQRLLCHVIMSNLKL